MIWLVLALWTAGMIDAYMTVTMLSNMKGWKLWLRVVLWPICTFVYVIESVLGI